jgi:WXXGXW repeat (2 copies)
MYSFKPLQKCMVKRKICIMKKLLSVLFVFGFLTTGIGLSAGAQTIYVKVRPVIPVVVRPAPPSPHHVWVAEEWRPNGAGYVYSGGYWAAPPHPGWVWIPGHWKKHEYGEYWVAGHWRHA